MVPLTESLVRADVACFTLTVCSMSMRAVCRLHLPDPIQVAADISTASPAWGTDALYLLIALGLAGAAWGSRSTS